MDLRARLDLFLARVRRRQSQSLDRFPNEILRTILSKVQTQHLQHLVRLRLVSSRWNPVIEDICKDKKCLMIVNDRDKNNLSDFSKQFNGHFKLDNGFVVIQSKSKFEMRLSGQLCTSLMNLFPQIEQFYIIERFSYSPNEFSALLRQWSSTLTTLSLYGLHFGNVLDLCSQMNQMTKLQRLDLAILPREKVIQLAPTLARLEHLSVWNFDAIPEIVPLLGNGFASLGIYYHYVTMDEMTNWARLSAQSVSTLARLSLRTFNPQVLPFVCEHFSSLKMLRINLFYSCNLTTTTIKHLGQLSHLTELLIDCIKIDLAVLDAAQLIPLANIHNFSLVDFKFVFSIDNAHQLYYRLLSHNNFDVAHFGRVLSAAFPNVTKLTVKSETYPQFGQLLEPHLNLFAHLRSFNVDNNSIVRLMD